MKNVSLSQLGLAVLAIAISANAQTFSVLYDFETNSGDPCNTSDSGIVAQGRDGNLYSTAPYCGANNAGAVFRITPGGTLAVLYSFDGTHGSFPSSGLTLGTDGNFYGTTRFGGIHDVGTIFKVTPTGNLSVLYHFTGGKDGSEPLAPPVQGADGNFYGTTPGYVAGTIYKITPSGTFTSLYQLNFNFTDGTNLYAPLVLATDGNFYGTASSGGPHAGGTVFKITPAGKFTMLYGFSSADGGSPIGPLVQSSDGNFYGTTSIGGTGNGGMVFKISRTGVLTVMHEMNGTDGGGPQAGLVQASDGSLYGVNIAGGSVLNCPGEVGCGTIFKIDGNGVFSVINNFDYANGAYPVVTLLQHTNGVLYGDTWGGGLSNPVCTQSTGCGVFYSWDASLPAFVTLLPLGGKIGKTVQILGQGFTGATAVSFNGVPAKFRVLEDTFLGAIVPNGAKTGFVTVTAPGGALKSNRKFVVIP